MLFTEFDFDQIELGFNIHSIIIFILYTNSNVRYQLKNINRANLFYYSLIAVLEQSFLDASPI